MRGEPVFLHGEPLVLGLPSSRSVYFRLAEGGEAVQHYRMPDTTARLLAITRDISPAIEHCELTHLERTTIDLTRARAEHEAYGQTLRELGCRGERRAAEPDQAGAVCHGCAA